MSRARGFTYIGLLIFLAILGLASAMTLSVGSFMQQRANEDELIFIGGQYANAFRSYFDSTPAGLHPFPAKLDELLRDPRYPGVRRHLRQIYVDPMTGKEQWGTVAAPGGGIMGLHSLSQQAPIKVSGFDPGFAPLSDKKKYSEWVFGIVPPGIGAQAGTVAMPGAKPAAPGADAAKSPGPGLPALPPGAVVEPERPATAAARDPKDPPPRTPDAARPAALEVSVPRQAMVNDVITVEVGLAAGSAARSAQITLNFDPQTLQLRSISGDSTQDNSGASGARAGRATVSLQNPLEGRALGPAVLEFHVVSDARPATAISVSATVLDTAGKRLTVSPLPPQMINLSR